MSDERAKAEELASLWALDLLDPQEAMEFHQRVIENPDLLQQGIQFQSDWAQMATALPLSAPPPALRRRVLQTVGAAHVPEKKTHTPAESGASASLVIPWTLAFACAAGAFFLYDAHLKTQDQLLAAQTEMSTLQLNTKKWEEAVAQWEKASKLSAEEARLAKQELAAVQHQNAMAKVEIASLKSSLAQYQEGVAVVIWDPEKQQGVLKLEKMPPTMQDKDYQLWVIDTKKGSPVDAGVVRVDDQGLARIDFKPQEAIENADKFAISVEAKGGSTTERGPQGQIILMNN